MTHETFDTALANIDKRLDATDVTDMSPESLDRLVTDTFCDEVKRVPFDGRPDIMTLYDALWARCHKVIRRRNHANPSDDRFSLPRHLDNGQIVKLLMLVKHIANVVMAIDVGSSDGKQLAMYCDEGPNEGVWLTDEQDINSFLWSSVQSLSQRDVDEIRERLRANAPTVNKTTTPTLIPVANGIFDYKKKVLRPFDSKYVFLSKLQTKFNPQAHDVDIVMPNGEHFSVKGWMRSLSDDPEVVQLLWELISAVIRPRVAWNKSAFLFSETGNNGKGTFCRMLRNLLGRGVSTSIPIRSFDKDFMLEPLVTAQAIITDENSIGTYLQEADNFKCIITHDPVAVNRKHKRPITIQFDGFMVQCFNELPRMKDRTDSLYRRQLFIPMDKCFTGHEIKEIKQDYLARPEVLEYILYRALMSDFNEFSNPQAAQDALEAYKEYNDPLREFFNRVICDRGSLDAYTWTQLYQMYIAWMQETTGNPSPRVEKLSTFTANMVTIINQSTEWESKGPRWQFRVGTLMAGTEPLFKQYRVNSTRPGANPNSKDAYTDVLPHDGRIRGIRRRHQGTGRPIGEEGHATTSSVGTNAQTVTSMSLDDIMVLPNGELSLHSGAPVPDDLLAVYEALHRETAGTGQPAVYPSVVTVDDGDDVDGNADVGQTSDVTTPASPTDAAFGIVSDSTAPTGTSVTTSREGRVAGRPVSFADAGPTGHQGLRLVSDDRSPDVTD